MESDVAYFRRRGSEELIASAKAEIRIARQRHVDLANRYLDLAQAIEDSTRELVTQGNDRPDVAKAINSQSPERVTLWL